MVIAGQSDRPAADPAPRALFPIQTVWTISLDHQLSVRAAFDAAHVYFATDDGRLAAYELARGTPIWNVAARPQHDITAGDGLVFIAEPDRVTAHRASDGGVAWEVPFAEALASSPAWGTGRLAVATHDGVIALLRSSDGHVLWRRDLSSAAHSRLALTADRVYVPAGNGRLVSLRADTGATVWERRVGGAVTDFLALDARLYVGSTDNFFYCLNTRDGRVQWRWRTGADVIGVPAVDERNVYFVSLDNVLRALSRASGVQRWFRPLSLRPTAGPVKAGATLIVPGLAPTLPTYDAKDGAPTGGGVAAGTGDTPAQVHLISSETAERPGVVIVAHGATAMTATLVTRQP